MKSLPPLRLGVACLLATSQLLLLAQDVPKLISQPQSQPLPETKKRVPVSQAKLLQLRPGETAEQRAARHEQELAEAEGKIAAAAKEFPLLTAPGWEKKQAIFKAELEKLKADPKFQRKPPAPPKFEPGKRPVPKTAAQLVAERKEADLALMRQQAEQVVQAHPELRAFIEQNFQWHERVFTLVGKYADNSKVREMLVNRLAHPARAK
jgi:hypothetical protein